MTTSHPTEPPALTWAELDLLADWSVGEISGPEADRVAHLVRSDPAWARAHAELVGAQPAVDAWLADATAATAAEQMPDDLAARLDAKLSAIAAQALPVPAGRSSSRRLTSDGNHRPPVHPPAARGADNRPPRTASPRRRPARAVLAMAAMALVVLGGFAVFRDLLGSVADSNFTASEGAGPDKGADPEAEPPAALPSRVPHVALSATGTDYQPNTLADFATTPNSLSPALDSGELLAGPLSELSTTQGFNGCVATVERQYSGRVVAADFAKYLGQPALVLLLQRAGETLVIAVGGDCGAAGADEMAAVAATR